jgi:hypothetical protein
MSDQDESVYIIKISALLGLQNTPPFELYLRHVESLIIIFHNSDGH